MSRFLSGGITAIAITVLVWGTAASAAEKDSAGSSQGSEAIPIRVIVEGQGEVTFESHPVIVDDVTMVPFRPLFEAMGLEVLWYGDSRTVIGQGYGKLIDLQLGRWTAYVDQMERRLQVPPRLIDGVTYVPLRFVGEASGRKVEWQDKGTERLITIGRAPSASPNRTVEIMAPYINSLDGLNSEIELELEERSGYGLDINWKPYIHVQDYAHLVIASGRLPDVMFFTDPMDSRIASFVPEMFWDLGPFLQEKEYKHLMSCPKEVWDGAAWGGAVYGIPHPYAMAAEPFPYIRKDWLERLDLAAPRTMDELYQVLEQFTLRDPDGNGVQDTFGMTGDIQFEDLGSYSWVEHVFNGSNGRLRLEHDTLKDTWVEDGTRQALLWLRKAYSNGYIRMEENYRVKGREAVTAGQAGAGTDALSVMDNLQAQLQKKEPSASLLPLPSLKKDSDGAEFAPVGPGLNGMYLISRKVPEEKVRSILALFDYAVSPEGQAIVDKGAEAFQTYGQIFEAYTSLPYKPEGEWDTALEKLVKEREAIGTRDPAYGLHSETLERLAGAWGEEAANIKYGVITGKRTIEDWDAYITEMKDSLDYKDMMEELNESYLKRTAGSGGQGRQTE